VNSLSLHRRRQQLLVQRPLVRELRQEARQLPLEPEWLPILGLDSVPGQEAREPVSVPGQQARELVSVLEQQARELVSVLEQQAREPVSVLEQQAREPVSVLEQQAREPVSVLEQEARELVPVPLRQEPRAPLIPSHRPLPRIQRESKRRKEL
jgi:hypothetical protein